MLERIRNLLGGGILSRYQADAVVLKHTFYTISVGREKKTLRPVLVKVYTDEGMEVQDKLDEKYRDKPLSEILPELSNRFVVKTIETGRAKGRRVEVLEAAPTTTLGERIGARNLSVKALRRAILQAGEGLMYLHSLGYVHRGISPDAIAVTPEGDAKIIDLSLLMDSQMTHAGGTMVGPSGYVAPEVIKRSAIDERCDIWALGAVCYEAFCGVKPFPNGHGYEALLKVINSKPQPLEERNRSVPADLNAVVMKALEKYPEHRYAKVEEMLTDFAAARLPDRTTNRAAAFTAA